MAIVKHKGLSLESMEDMKDFAQQVRISGILGHCKSKEEAVRVMGQAVVKIQYGAEFGIGPMQAIQNIQIVQGKPSMSASLQASLVKASGRYDYRVKKHTDTECVIDFYDGKDLIGTSSFTMKDAQGAGLTKNPVWKSYPKNMLFSRALTNGARWYCADVFNGTVYSPDEIESIPVKAVKQVASSRETDRPERLIAELSAVDEDGVVVNEPPPVEEEHPEPGSFEPEGDLDEHGDII